MIVTAAILSVIMGLVLGLLGGGGSILTVPILLYVAGLPPKQAIATSLLVVGLTSLSGLVRHHRLGNVRWRVGLGFGAVAMAGAFLGGRLSAFVPGPALMVLFASLMAVSAVGMLRSKRERRPLRFFVDNKAWGLAIQGLVVGMLTGLVGAGGGFLIVPALVFLAGLTMRQAVGTSLLIIALNSGAGLAGQLTHVDIPVATALLLSATAIVGSIAGVALSERIAPRALRRAFGVFVLAMAAYILLRQVPEPMLASLLHGPALYVLGAVGLGTLVLIVARTFREAASERSAH